MKVNELHKKIDKANAFVYILVSKVEEFVKASELEDSILKRPLIIKLISDNGYTLLWSKKYYSFPSMSISDGLFLTLMDPQGNVMYEMGLDFIKRPEMPKCFEVLDKCIEIASKLQLNSLDIIGDNAILEYLEEFCGKYLGIGKKDYSTKITDYHLTSPDEECMTIDVDGYLITYKSLMSDSELLVETVCCKEGDIIKQVRKFKDLEWYDVSQSLLMRCDENSYVQLDTSWDGLKIEFVDSANNIQRRIELSIGNRNDECRGKLKELIIIGNGKDLLRASYRKQDNSVNSGSNFSTLNKDANCSSYEAIVGDETIAISEQDVSCILYHPEIRDFILGTIKIIKERYPILADKIFRERDFDSPLRIIKDKYEKGCLPTDSARVIVDEAIKRGMSFKKILELIEDNK